MDQNQNLPRSGVIVPMVTPMHPDGTVDADSFASLSAWLVGQGVDGLLVLGSTGESAAMAASEKERAVRSVVSAVGGRTHVMVGVASLGTPGAVDDAGSYAALGADSLLVSAPFGFPLSQDELSGHFRSVASAAPGTPLVAYEVPSRVKVSLEAPLLKSLAGDGIIHALKDSSGNVGGARLRSLALEGTGLWQYTGSEECIDGFLLSGGHASVPGLANVFPSLHVELARRAERGDWERAREVQDTINRMLALYFHPLPGASFTAQFFAIVKEVLRQRGVIADAATSPPFVRGDDDLVRFVAEFLAAMQPEVDRATVGAS